MRVDGFSKKHASVSAGSASCQPNGSALHLLGQVEQLLRTARSSRSATVRRSVGAVVWSSSGSWSSSSSDPGTRVAHDRAGHAARAAAAPAELGAGDRDDLDALRGAGGCWCRRCARRRRRRRARRRARCCRRPTARARPRSGRRRSRSAAAGRRRARARCASNTFIAGARRAVAARPRARSRGRLVAQLGIDGERVPVDHGHDRVEVHGRAPLRQHDGDHLAGRAGGEQALGQLARPQPGRVRSPMPTSTQPLPITSTSPPSSVAGPPRSVAPDREAGIRRTRGWWR